MKVYKIFTVREMLNFMCTGKYFGNKRDKELGFIHLCKNKKQLSKIKHKIKPTYENDLSIAKLDVNPKYIKFKNGYPNFYGYLNLQDVTKIYKTLNF